MTRLYPVILSGGAGTRLWPMSRSDYPKQFMPLTGDRTLFQQAVLRVTGDCFAPVMVICNQDHRFVVAEQLRQIDHHNAAILLEPAARNTAPAACVAALSILDQDADGVMLIMPSDHCIQRMDIFSSALATALPAARQGHMVTFGIHPDRPETGYGYMRHGAELPGLSGVLHVDAFVEKPSLPIAAAYVADGRHAWNSGLFLVRAATYVAELQRLHPMMVDACRQALADHRLDHGFCWLDATAFAQAPALSIDYAVMEHTALAAMVPVDMGWSDVGAWSALWDIADKDQNGNGQQGPAILVDSRQSYVHSDGRLVAVVGMDDVVVVSRDDAVLVLNRQRAQDVKQVVDQLPAAYLQHTLVHRPWGTYHIIDRGDGFLVKRLVVKPGERLSLQYHQQRAEHWVVVQGTARVTRGDQVFLLDCNQSTFIPQGQIHRLENPGPHPLHLIEVQSGAYIAEDDIVRLEDRHGRT